MGVSYLKLVLYTQEDSVFYTRLVNGCLGRMSVDGQNKRDKKIFLTYEFLCLQTHL